MGSTLPKAEARRSIGCPISGGLIARCGHSRCSANRLAFSANRLA